MNPILCMWLNFPHVSDFIFVTSGPSTTVVPDQFHISPPPSRPPPPLCTNQQLGISGFCFLESAWSRSRWRRSEGPSQHNHHQPAARRSTSDLGALASSCLPGTGPYATLLSRRSSLPSGGGGWRGRRGVERGVRECCCVQSVGSGPTILVVVALLLQLPEDPAIGDKWAFFCNCDVFVRQRKQPHHKKPSIIKWDQFNGYS